MAEDLGFVADDVGFQADDDLGFQPDTHDAGIVESILSSAAAIGDKVDSYTGAPARKALSELVDTGNPLTAIQSGWEQVGKDNKTAPRGTDIAKKMGISEDPLNSILPKEIFEDQGSPSPIPFLPPKMAQSLWEKIGASSPADAAGLGIDFGADPLLIPMAKIAKPIAKGVGAAAEIIPGVKSAKEVGSFAGDLIKSAPGVTVDAVKGAKNKLASRISPEFAKFKTVAEKNGIPLELLPESVEFGQNSAASRIGRNVNEMAGGEIRLKRHQAGVDRVKGAIEADIEKIGAGSPMDGIAAGEHLKNSFERGVDNFFKDIDWTHSTVIANAPGLQVSEKGLKAIDSKLLGLERWAKGKATRGFQGAQRAQAEEVLRAIEAIREGNGSYKQTYEALQDIGEVAFKPVRGGAVVPPDVQKFRDLYFTISDALLDTTKTSLGKEIGSALEANNKRIHEFLGEKGVLSPVVQSMSMAPESVFQSVIKNGDSRKLSALKSILPAEDIQRLKGAFLDSILKRGADGELQFGRLRGSLQDKKNIVNALFEPGEIDNINSLLELGEAFGPSVLSTSGTGASNSLGNLVKSVGDGIFNESYLEAMKSRARKQPPLPFPDDPIALPMKQAAGVKPPMPIDAMILGAKTPYLMQMSQPPPQETNIERAKRMNQQNQGM